MPPNDIRLTPRAHDAAVDAPAGAAVGAPADRVDGRDKVTGAARYSAEFPFDGLLYGVTVESKIARGRLAAVDASAAERAPGVVRVFTHENARTMHRTEPDPSEQRYKRPVPALQDDGVPFNGAYVALVVARTFEEARHAADLVAVRYEAEAPHLDFRGSLGEAKTPESMLGEPPKPDTSKGHFASAFEAAPVRVDANYETPYEHNNPIEPHATIAVWSDDERLTLYDATQSADNARTAVAQTFGLQEEQVRVVCKFIGGGFGSKGQTWGHATLAAMAAMELKRPVKVVVGRREMFMTTGHRPGTIQRVRLGAEPDGRLTAIAHDSFLQNSAIDEYCEAVGSTTRVMYAADHRQTTHRVVPLDLPTPNIMRAPGEAPGSFALESAMDELAVALGMDPIALRVRNEPETDPESGHPFSSRSLVVCLREGAERFGWARRDPRPRSMRDGRTLVGYGVAASTYPARTQPSEATVTVDAGGRAHVRTAATDIGTGTWTVLAQVAADALGFPLDRVTIEIGDSDLPKSAGSGGSRAASSNGSAVHDACTAMRAQLAALARHDARSPLHHEPLDRIRFRGGRVEHADDPARGEPAAALFARNAGAFPLQAHGALGRRLSSRTHAMHAFGAQFAEVAVDEDTGVVRLRRMLGVFACGRILNAKTARSQLLGAMVMGAGMALMEESYVDARFGHFVNHDLADYHVPVQLDIAAIDAAFLPEHDDKVNPLGTKGVGEIGIVGPAAAIANAVYHATGVRVRDLPITMDKVLTGMGVAAPGTAGAPGLYASTADGLHSRD